MMKIFSGRGESTTDDFVNLSTELTDPKLLKWCQSEGDQQQAGQ